MKKVGGLLRKGKKTGRACKYRASLWLTYVKMRRVQKMLPSEVFRREYKKYVRCMKTDIRKDLVFMQAKAFLECSFERISDCTDLPADPLQPVLLVVVRNEAERMKTFIRHYRALGITRFVVLDNGSDDGTAEYLASQEGIAVYRTTQAFQTQKKEAWIEMLLAVTGTGRWYVAVDSDELLDYVGSEEHPVTELIRSCSASGYGRINGFLLDMYAKEPLFRQNASGASMTDICPYFDRSGYILNHRGEPGAVKKYDEIYGGPRYRVFGSNMTLSKQSVFYYGGDTLYRSCHFLYPVIRWEEAPCLFVLRHYKFLPCDRAEYERRVCNQSFYNGSSEYRKIMRKIENDGDMTLFCDDSEYYADSGSLKCLPYLEKTDWITERKD